MPPGPRVAFVYSRIASATFAVEAVFPIAHRLTGARYHGFTHVYDVVIDVGLTTIWLVAAVVALFRRPVAGLAILLAGAATSIIHGLLFTIASTARSPSIVGLPFLGAALVQFFCAALAFPEFIQSHERRHIEETGSKPWHWNLVSRRAF